MAEDLLQESLALSQRLGYREGVAWSLNQLGIVERRRASRIPTRLKSWRANHDEADRVVTCRVVARMLISDTDVGAGSTHTVSVALSRRATRARTLGVVNR